MLVTKDKANVTFDFVKMRLAANYIITCYLSRLGIK